MRGPVERSRAVYLRGVDIVAAFDQFAQCLCVALFGNVGERCGERGRCESDRQ